MTDTENIPESIVSRQLGTLTQDIIFDSSVQIWQPIWWSLNALSTLDCPECAGSLAFLFHYVSEIFDMWRSMSRNKFVRKSPVQK